MNSNKTRSFSSTAVLKHSIVECEIERLGVNGEGISSIEGVTLFVTGALPGEKVRVRITDVSSSYVTGKILDQLTQSQSRVQPFCKVYGRCGGCQLMHLSGNGQLKYKRQRIQDELTHTAGLTDVEVRPCLESPGPKAYRNKIELPFRMRDRNRTFGFFREGSHDIIRVENCPVHLQQGERIYKTVREAVLESPIPPYDENRHSKGLRHIIIRTAASTGKAQVILVTNEINIDILKKLAGIIMSRTKDISGIFCNENTFKNNVVLGKKMILLAGEQVLRETVGKWSYDIGPSSFFQVNPGQSAVMLNKVIEAAAVTPNDKVLDAYCGAGFFSIPLAEKAHSVVGVEEVEEAVALADRNAKLNNIKNAKFIAGQAEKVISEIDRCDIVVVDPPRKGCAASFLEVIIKMAPRRIVYVSCNPSTLARDLKIICEAGYKTEYVQPLDMFPQTAHVEAIAVINKL
ncbi:MAG: 23S rRNA (uracil(1939)-C(5))-methyltransferase RlmD [Fibrobacteres bacterium]|nr:23S rRNA (uracil(1939)-C(5))-methyltransferase RlmD [Fibrobacterota bacterium]